MVLTKQNQCFWLYQYLIAVNIWLRKAYLSENSLLQPLRIWQAAWEIKKILHNLCVILAYIIMGMPYWTKSKMLIWGWRFFRSLGKVCNILDSSQSIKYNKKAVLTVLYTSNNRQWKRLIFSRLISSCELHWPWYSLQQISLSKSTAWSLVFSVLKGCDLSLFLFNIDGRLLDWSPLMKIFILVFISSNPKTVLPQCLTEVWTSIGVKWQIKSGQMILMGRTIPLWKQEDMVNIASLRGSLLCFSSLFHSARVVLCYMLLHSIWIHCHWKIVDHLRIAMSDNF